MGWFKRQKVTDERIENLKNKIYREIYILVIIYCLLSILVKRFYFDLTIEHLITELALFVVVGLYYTFRSVRLGIYSEEMELQGQKKKQSSSLLFITILVGFVFAITMGINSAVSYAEGTWESVYYFFLVFIVSLIFYIPVLTLVFVVGHEIAKNRSEKNVEKQLEELDGDEDEKY